LNLLARVFRPKRSSVLETGGSPKLHAARLCLAVVLVAVVAGCLIAAATKHAIWPFQAGAVLIGISYFYGLWFYGTAREEADRVAREHDDRDGM
jgi:hypothetical protein